MDKIKEVMTAFNEACSASYEAGAIGAIGSVGTIRRAREKQAAAMEAFKDKLRELLEREPLSDESRYLIFDDLFPHGADSGIRKLFSLTVDGVERAHGIGNESKGM